MGGRLQIVPTARAIPIIPDPVPNAFPFTNQSDVALSTLITSAPVTISGINVSVGGTVSGGGGAVSVNGGAYSTAPFTVNNGDSLSVQHFSSGANSTAVNSTVTIGGVSQTFTSTTLAGGGGGANSATLIWTAPTAMNNESAPDIAGYRIYIGTSAAGLGPALDVGPGTLTYTFNSLAPGTYYFAVKPFDSLGVEGDMSVFGSKVIT